MSDKPVSECEFDPDHLYHDHRERDELRAEVERLQQVVESTTGLNHRLAAECVERLQDQERLRTALEQMVEVFGPFANMSAGRPAIDQARKVLGRSANQT